MENSGILWFGKPIESYPKEELIKIVCRLANDLKEYQSPHISKAVAKAKAKHFVDKCRNAGVV